MPKVTRKSGRPRGNGGEIERREISECEAQEGEAWTQHCQGFRGAVLNVPWRVHRPSEEEQPLGCWPAASPNRESGPPRLGLALGGHAGSKKPPDTQPNIALRAPPVPGGGHGLPG